MKITDKHKLRISAGLGAIAIIAGAAGWSLSPVLPPSPLQSRASHPPIPAVPAEWNGGNSIADIVERTEPAVVSITVEQQSEPVALDGDPFGDGGPFGDFFRQFVGPPGLFRHIPRERGEALGSGFVVDNSGDILTNNHVVEGGTRFTVEFADKSIAQARLVGTDKESDLALIHVDKMPAVQPLAFADSDKLRVGDPVIAIGNPYGVGQTVTAGVVSARGRSLGNSSYVDYIQTDASINQGNSGGPLLDYSGRVVGVNSAIFSPSGGNVGIGFAVPANTAQQVVDGLRKNGKVTRAWLGIGIQDVTPAIAAADGLDKAEGAIVTTVDGSGPSAGKLEAGDIIRSFNGMPVREARDLSKAAASAPIGNPGKLGIIRQGSAHEVTVKLGQLAQGRTDHPAVPATGGEETAPRLGLSTAPLDDDARAELHLPGSVGGVVVTDIDPDGAGARSGLQAGDVIERIGGERIGNAADVKRALALSNNDTALLLINRGGDERFLAVPLG